MEKIEAVLKEDRVFEPSEAFKRAARINQLEAYEALYRESLEQPEQFWSRVASELHWFKPWDKVLEWNPPQRQVVHRRQNQPLLQLPGSAPGHPG